MANSNDNGGLDPDLEGLTDADLAAFGLSREDLGAPKRDRSAQQAQLAEAQAMLAELGDLLGASQGESAASTAQAAPPAQPGRSAQPGQAPPPARPAQPGQAQAAPGTAVPQAPRQAGMAGAQGAGQARQSGVPAWQAQPPQAQPAGSPTQAQARPASPNIQPQQPEGKPGRFLTGRVLAWSFWDWGSAAFNAVIVTFVFSVYLTNAGMFGERANTLYGWVTAGAGILVAAIAPAVGQWTDRTGRRRLILNGGTLLLVVTMALLYFVKPGMLWLGLFLIGLGNIIFEVSEVIYNSMVGQVSKPGTVGRVSGFGWGMGYVGGIVLLVVIYIGFIKPEVGWFGVETAEGGGVRFAMLICAAWTLLFSIPIMLLVRNGEPNGTTSTGVIGAYREVGRSIARLWRADRSVVWFLLSAAVYRDGLAGVFAFGGVLAAAGFGFSADEVMIFGIAANVVAGIATIGFGKLDDVWGAKKVIVVSLLAMLAFAMAIFFFHAGGKLVFWIFGLGLCVFVGPVQSASRSYLSRITPPGEEGEVFGLYATCGRAVSFLAPFMYSASITFGASKLGISEGDAAHWGIVGIAIVLVLGLVMFLPVRAVGKGDAQ